MDFIFDLPVNIIFGRGKAELIGSEGVKAALSGITGEVMVFRRICDKPYSTVIDHVPAGEIANKEKLLPSQWINAEKNNVTDRALDYFLPLIQGEVNVLMKNGIPVHFQGMY